MNNNVCNRRCTSCRFHGKLNGTNIICNYWAMTGNLRGCPAGSGCTKYEPGKRKRGELYKDMFFPEQRDSIFKKEDK